MMKYALLLFLPFFWVNSGLSATAPAPSPKVNANSPSAEKSADQLSLKREDLLEGADNSWFPVLKVKPEDFNEDLEIPQRSRKDDEEPIKI